GPARDDCLLALDRRPADTVGSSRAGIERVSARQPGGHHDAGRHGREPAPPPTRPGSLIRLMPAAYRLDARLQDRRKPAARRPAALPAGWRIGDKPGNNGQDAAGDIAVAWPSNDPPILVCAYTQGGTPTPLALSSAFAAVGRRVDRELA